MKRTLTLLLLILSGCFCKTSAQTSTYVYTGAVQIYTVPPGVISLSADIYGAQGGDYTTAPVASGGLGGRVQCNLAVTPGELLYIYVGQKGTAGCYPCGLVAPPPGGTNSGGGANGGAGSMNEGGAAGGGSTDIRTVSYTASPATSLSSRLIAAGAGGGGAWDCGNENGGVGGGLTGGTGISCTAYNPAEAGSPGTQVSGGTLGSSMVGQNGTAGGFGFGGDAFGNFWGGGGGGGWFGAGGSYSGSGCGGSSFYGGVGVTGGTTTPGVRTGNGYVSIVVNCSAGLITGNTSICNGTTTTLIDTVGNSSGTWTSNNTAIATVVSSSGVVSGISAGTAIITYSVTIPCGSVYSIITVTVNPLPTAITGSLSVCQGVTTTLSDGLTGGTWTSGNTSIATAGFGTGVLGGVAVGTSMITYTLPTGCATTATATVNSLSTPITGTAAVCSGTTTTLSESTTGGTWSSGNTIIATVNVGSGIVTGGNVTAVSLVTITYTIAGGCSASKIVTVNPQPSSISGNILLCQGSTSLLSCTPIGGAWGSSNTGVASIVATGNVTGGAPGTSVISYTMAGGCSATAIMTVNPVPAPIAGALNICMGTTTTLTDATTGGFWTSSNSFTAAIDPFSGVVTAGALSTGTTTISYTLGTTCAATAILTVNIGPLPITGIFSVCAGASTFLNDDISGGGWSSDNTTVATIDGIGGLYSVSPGTTTISYTFATCTVTAIVTVNPLPLAITGTTVVCAGLTTTLSDATSGGTWSSSNTFVASVNIATGLARGNSPGIASIVYRLPTGCSVTTIVTVNSSPSPIGGTIHLCPGLTTTLTDGGGGTWASSNTGVATIGATGITGGIIPGTSVITYSLGVGCSSTAIVTVNPLPPAIGGTAAACAAGTTLLSDGTGTWSSNNTAIATAGSSSGVITGVAGGTATITFTSAANGCTAHITITINPLPAIISGSMSMCPGATTLLSDISTGGTWSSSVTIIATTNATGMISGSVPGTATITYTLPTGCSRSAVITVNALPPAITGVAAICAGATLTLHDVATGGLWTGSPASVATITPGGVVSGVGGGTAVISYTAGCTRTAIMSINPLPSPITGPTAECVGATITESTSPAGGTWISVSTSVATVGSSGTVTGAATGTTVIKYTTTAGCTALTTITVSLSPTAIIGGAAVCANDTMSLNDAVGGGAWSSSNTGVATIGSLNGIVTGVVAGTTSIAYSLGTGCTVNKTITVNPAPLAITGGTSICIGATTQLADLTGGGVWSSNTTTVANISGTGLVTGSAAGVDTITYTRAGCMTRTMVTVNLTPSAISGTLHVCAGATTILGDAVAGGSWTSSNIAIASIDATGTVTGALPGTTNITYSLGATCVVTKVVTVNPIATITGNTGMCVGATTTLSDAVTGGTWSSGATSIALVNAAGLVTGSTPGTAMITYTTPAGCIINSVVAVNLAPSAISGVLSVCAGATTTLGNSASGGVWTSSNTTVATVTGSGVVSGSIHGTTTITYSLGGGCTTSAVATVNAAPAAITGTVNLCAGATALLADAATGGIWSIAATTAATISGTGVVTTATAGTAMVSYTVNGCAVNTTVTVNTLPGAITGILHVCAGTMTTLGNAATGGIWSSSNTGIANANALTGDITGVAAGTAIVSYTLAAGCGVAVTISINSAPPPVSGITGICVGAVTLLSDAVGGGVWSSDNTTVATVSATGAVSGNDLGTATISYAVNGCIRTTIVSINSLPAAISGAARICAGTTTSLSDVGGGVWSSISPGVATVVASTGLVTGVSAGNAVIAYSMGAGCTVTAIVTVDATPLPITGTTEVCIGYATLLADASASGAWSSSNTAIATITGSGVVNGLTGGASTISYTNSAGCTAIRLVTVIAVPPITGMGDMCAYGSTLSLSDAVTGGFWTSTSASISSTGVVTPYSSGITTVTYTLLLGCYTTTTLIVNPSPGPVVGLNHLCLGSTENLSDTTAGGAWSSSNTAVGAISGAGVISGILAGTTSVRYTLPTGCSSAETITVDVPPSAGSIDGVASVCIGDVTALSDVAPGGIWGRSNLSVTVLDGFVSGVAVGTSIISYTVSNSCGSVVATRSVTINPLPFAGVITGAASVCAGNNITLADAAAGGVWSNSTAATTAAGGTIHGVTAGLDTIKYTVTTSCGIAMAEKPITVNALPEVAPITGDDALCTGIHITLADAVTGGSWSVANSHVSVNSAGIVNAVSTGIDTITYVVTNMCGTATANYTVTIGALPAAGVITGGTSICVGTKDTLAVTLPGGTWTTSNNNVAITATPTGVIITGMASGADTIVYTLSNACGQAVAVFPVSVCSTPAGSAVQAVAGERELLRVWPNPNNGTFTIVLSSATDEPVRVIITNLVGEKVREFSTTANKDAELKLNAAAGVYFITAATANRSYVAKVVVSN